jgi:Tol biopolymer transport system component
LAIAPGQQILHYRLIEQIGKGGMGVVWKAEDTKLGREVALKFLTEAFSGEAERLARFQREAKLLATLNHANIATLHGFEEAYGERFLVLELVQGENLADRVAQGPLPVGEVIPICRQIAEALDAAHESGIFHRDLKPANIKVTPGSVVKVLDFGLAKAWEPDPTSEDPSLSPTLTHEPTRTGMILGTAAYMSPEQARGRSTDKRTDIWSFGCILYELLSGRRAFAGETISDSIAAILKSEPDLTVLPEATPPRLLDLISRCLEKDRKRRLRDIGDARIELEKVEAGDMGTVATASTGPAQRWLPLAAVLVLGLVLGVLLRGWLAPDAATEGTSGQATHLSVVAPDGWVVKELRLSDDGRSLIFEAEPPPGQDDTSPRLFHRRLDSFETTPVPESENPEWVDYSPDSSRIAYMTQDPDGAYTIKKTSLEGGPVVELLELSEHPGDANGKWLTENELFFPVHHGYTLARMSADGGEPQELLTLEDEILWSGLHLLHEGRTLLYGTFKSAEAGVSYRTDALDLETGERRVIMEEGWGGPVPGGERFVFWRDYTWFGAPFDVERLEIIGPETPLFSNRKATFSDTGMMAYIPRHASTAESVVVVDRQGRLDQLADIEEGIVEELRWSPDGRQIALLSQDTDRLRRRLWTVDVARKNLVPLPTGDAWKAGISWTPSGDYLMVTLLHEDAPAIFRRGARPGDRWEPVFTDGPARDRSHWGAWSADGSVMAFLSGEEGGTWDLWLLPADEGAEPRPFIESPAVILTPAISPDGRWVAFVSDESGTGEVYVATLSGEQAGQNMVRVSDRGGAGPVWSPDGTELFFKDASGQLMAVVVERGGAVPRFGNPEIVLDLNALGLSTDATYDVSPDGSRFVFARPAGGREGSSEIFIVLDWNEQLERQVPLED